jgi:hypothetical protein
MVAWAQRLKRVFAIEIERCLGCGGRLDVIASIEAPALIERILEYLRQRAQEDQAPCRWAPAPRNRRGSDRPSYCDPRARRRLRPGRIARRDWMGRSL